ncbi:hypothetical protein Tco_0900756 [Tanacetum coccineum]
MADMFMKKLPFMCLGGCKSKKQLEQVHTPASGSFRWDHPTSSSFGVTPSAGPPLQCRIQGANNSFGCLICSKALSNPVYVKPSTKQYKQVSRGPRSGGEPAPSKVDNGTKFDQLPNLLPPVVSSDLPFQFKPTLLNMPLNKTSKKNLLFLHSTVMDSIIAAIPLPLSWISGKLHDGHFLDNLL